jgi:hypothetical protein
MSLARAKSPLKSKTVAGGVLGIVGSVVSYLELIGKLPIGAAGPVVGLIGGLVSIFGRVTAVSKLKW